MPISVSNCRLIGLLTTLFLLLTTRLLLALIALGTLHAQNRPHLWFPLPDRFDAIH